MKFIRLSYIFVFLLVFFVLFSFLGSAQCGDCSLSVFDESVTSGCSYLKDEAWYAFIDVTKFGTGPLSDFPGLADDPEISPDLCSHPGGNSVWQPGDDCTTDRSKYPGGVCGVACSCDNSTSTESIYAGTCKIESDLGGTCGKATYLKPGTYELQVVDSNVGDICFSDYNCGFLCHCGLEEGGERRCKRSPWSIPSLARGSAAVYNDEHEIIEKSEDALFCFLRVLRVWNDGRVDYYKDREWVSCFDENWEIPADSKCNEIKGLTVIDERELRQGGAISLMLVDKTYIMNESFTSIQGDCYDSSVNSEFGGNPCVCMCAKAGYETSGAGAYCEIWNTDKTPPACPRPTYPAEYNKHVVGGDTYCTDFWGGGVTNYSCCCTGESAMPRVSPKYNHHVAISDMYVVSGLLGNVLGVDESDYYDSLREALRDPDKGDIGRTDYYRIYTLARGCDVLGSVDDDANCKSNVVVPSYERQFADISTPNYFGEIEDKGFDDCTWKLIDYGKYCQTPGIYIALLNKSRFGTNVGFLQYSILGKENLSTRRIYNDSIFDGNLTNKNDVLEWNWWGGHRLLGCDLCEPGDITCSMGSSLAMWYTWKGEEGGRAICGFLTDEETGKPDYEFIADSVHSIETDVDALFIQDTVWNSEDRDGDLWPDGFECWGYSFRGTMTTPDYENPFPWGTHEITFGAFVPKCYLPWQNDFFANAGGGANTNWALEEGNSEYSTFTYTDDEDREYEIFMTTPIFSFSEIIDSGWGVIIEQMTQQFAHFNYSDYPMEGDCASEVAWAKCENDPTLTKECSGLSQNINGKLEETIIPCASSRCIADVASCFMGCYGNPGFPYVGGGESPYTYDETLFDQVSRRSNSFWGGVELTEFSPPPYEEECSVPGFDTTGWAWWVFKHAGIEALEKRLNTPDGYREILRNMAGETPALAQEICACGGCTEDFVLNNVQAGDIIFVDPCGTSTPVCPSANVCHMAISSGGNMIMHSKRTTKTGGVGLVEEPIPPLYYDPTVIGIDSIFRLVNLPPGGFDTYECLGGTGSSLPPENFDPANQCRYADQSCDEAGLASPCGDQDFQQFDCPKGILLSDVPYVSQCSGATGALTGTCDWLSDGNCICRYGCGPTSLSMALEKHGKGSALDILESICLGESPQCTANTCGEVNCIGDKGEIQCCSDSTCGCVKATGWEGLKAAITRLGGGYEHITSGGSIHDLWNALNDGNPVIALINHHNINYKQHNCQANVNTELNGHYVAVIGMSDDVNHDWIILNDPNVPSTCNQRITMPTSAFFAAWQDKGNKALVVKSSSASKSEPGPLSLSVETGKKVDTSILAAGQFADRDDCIAFTASECSAKNADGCNLNCDCFNTVGLTACEARIADGCAPVQCSGTNDYPVTCVPIGQAQKLPAMPGGIDNPMPAQPDVNSFVSKLKALKPIPVDKINRLPDSITTKVTSEVMEKVEVKLNLPFPADKVEKTVEKIIGGIVKSKVSELIQTLVINNLPDQRIPDPYTYIPQTPAFPDVPMSMEFSQYIDEWPATVPIPTPEDDPALEPINYPRLGILSEVHDKSEDLHDGVENVNYYLETTNENLERYKAFALAWNSFRGYTTGATASVSFDKDTLIDAVTDQLGAELDFLDGCDGACKTIVNNQVGGAFDDAFAELPEFTFAGEVDAQLGFSAEELPELPTTDIPKFEPLPLPPIIANYNEILPQIYSCDRYSATASVPEKKGSFSVLAAPNPEVILPKIENLEDVYYPTIEVPNLASIVTGAGAISPYYCSRPMHKDHETGSNEPYDPSKWDLIDLPWYVGDEYPPGVERVDGHTKPVYCSTDGKKDDPGGSQNNPRGEKNDFTNPWACFDYDLKYYRQINRDSLWANVFQLTPEVYMEMPSIGTPMTCSEVEDAGTEGWFDDWGEEKQRRACENADNIVDGGCFFDFETDGCFSCPGEDEHDRMPVIDCQNYSQYDGDTGSEDRETCIEDWCKVGPCDWKETEPNEKLRCVNATLAFVDRCHTDCGIDCDWDRCDHIAEYVDQNDDKILDGCWFEPSEFLAGSKCYNCDMGENFIGECANYTNEDSCMRNDCGIHIVEPPLAEVNQGCIWDVAEKKCKDMIKAPLDKTCSQLCNSKMYSMSPSEHEASAEEGIITETSCTLNKCEKASELLPGSCWFNKKVNYFMGGSCYECLGGKHSVKSCDDYSQEGGYSTESCNENSCQANLVGEVDEGCGWTEAQGCLPKGMFGSCKEFCGEGWFNKCGEEECNLLSEVFADGCWLDSTTTPDSCWNCQMGDKPVTGCRDYTNDNACLTNPCKLSGGCGWDGEQCLGSVNLDMEIFTRTGGDLAELPGPLPPIPGLGGESGGPVWIHAGGGFTIPNEDEAKKIWNEQKDFGFYESLGDKCMSQPFPVESFWCVPNPLDLIKQMKDNSMEITGRNDMGSSCLNGMNPMDHVPPECGEICGKEVIDLKQIELPNGESAGVWPDYHTWINTTIEEFNSFGIPVIIEKMTRGDQYRMENDPLQNYTHPFSGNIFPVPAAPWKLLNWFNVEHSIGMSANKINITGDYHVKSLMKRVVKTQQCAWHGCDLELSKQAPAVGCVPPPGPGTPVWFQCKGQWHKYGCSYPVLVNISAPPPFTGIGEALMPMPERFEDYSIVDYEPYGDQLTIEKMSGIPGLPGVIDIDVEGYIDYREDEKPLDVRGKLEIKAEPDYMNGFDLVLPGIAVVEYSRNNYPALHKLFRTNTTGDSFYGDKEEANQIFLDSQTKFFMEMGDIASVNESGGLQNVDWSLPWYFWMRNPVIKFYDMRDLFYAQDSIYSWYVNLEAPGGIERLWFDKSKSIGLFRNFHEDEPLYYDLSAFGPVPRYTMSRPTETSTGPRRIDPNIKITSLDNRTTIFPYVVYNEKEGSFSFTFTVKLNSVDELEKGYLRVYTPLRYKDYKFSDGFPAI
ncbi:MAG: C39 family peptidase [Candidatus Altiarchaeota archaeon]